jgi:hypothetical protein
MEVLTLIPPMPDAGNEGDSQHTLQAPLVKRLLEDGRLGSLIKEDCQQVEGSYNIIRYVIGVVSSLDISNRQTYRPEIIEKGLIINVSVIDHRYGNDA